MLDKKSKSDCFVVLYALRGKQKMKTKIGQTEIKWDSDNPDFVQSFEMDFFFEEVQSMLVEAYDLDDEKNPNNYSK